MFKRGLAVLHSSTKGQAYSICDLEAQPYSSQLSNNEAIMNEESGPQANMIYSNLKPEAASFGWHQVMTS